MQQKDTAASSGTDCKKVLGIYPYIIAEIRASEQLRSFWKKYQRDFDYTKDISFDDACDAVRCTMNSIKE